MQRENTSTIDTKLNLDHSYMGLNTFLNFGVGMVAGYTLERSGQSYSQTDFNLLAVPAVLAWAESFVNVRILKRKDPKIWPIIRTVAPVGMGAIATGDQVGRYLGNLF